jgi:hypothetical protein
MNQNLDKILTRFPDDCQAEASLKGQISAQALFFLLAGENSYN